ncbi:MAG TPA: hypothetical protein VFQ45_07980 [Longimicrobium sp.]|nr:hypothetical protein [Longimicrobium sp.]
MRKALRLVPALAVLALAACEDAAERTLAPGKAPSLATLYDDEAVPLAVTVTGPKKVLRESTVTYTATVSGGSGSYYYNWIAHVCYPEGYCLTPMKFAWGSGMSSVRRLIRADEASVKVSVQVREDADVHYTGVNHAMTIAPASWTDQVQAGGWGCIAPQDYPFRDWVRDPVTGEWGTKQYRRKCDGTREYPPTSP